MCLILKILARNLISTRLNERKSIVLSAPSFRNDFNNHVCISRGKGCLRNQIWVDDQECFHVLVMQSAEFGTGRQPPKPCPSCPPKSVFARSVDENSWKTRSSTSNALFSSQWAPSQTALTGWTSGETDWKQTKLWAIYTLGVFQRMRLLIYEHCLGLDQWWLRSQALFLDERRSLATTAAKLIFRDQISPFGEDLLWHF